MSSKQREALAKCMEFGKKIDESLGSDESTVWTCRYERSYAKSIEEIAKEALAEPMKNCEVGTVEEQTERFRKFCFAHMKKGGGDFSCHKNCPAKNYIGGWGIPYCQLKWAQMPYEEGGEK